MTPPVAQESAIHAPAPQRTGEDILRDSLAYWRANGSPVCPGSEEALRQVIAGGRESMPAALHRN